MTAERNETSKMENQPYYEAAPREQNNLAQALFYSFASCVFHEGKGHTYIRSGKHIR